MNDYEGLNLPQLLELMHEIVMPAPISRGPEGPGWWIVLAWLVAVSVIVTRAWLAHRRRNRYRREAIEQLDQIAATADADPAAAAAGIALVLKRVALAAWPRDEVAALTGEAWAEFLSNSAANDPLVAEACRSLAVAAWHPDADGRQLLAPAKRWVKVHRA